MSILAVFSNGENLINRQIVQDLPAAAWPFNLYECDVPGLRVLLSESEATSDQVLAEFIRSVLLSGNGTLLINNTFVEWATVQTVLRAKPSVAVVPFGVRNKINPFSSLLIYTEQHDHSGTHTG